MLILHSSTTLIYRIQIPHTDTTLAEIKRLAKVDAHKNDDYSDKLFIPNNENVCLSEIFLNGQNPLFSYK